MASLPGSKLNERLYYVLVGLMIGFILAYCFILFMFHVATQMEV